MTPVFAISINLNTSAKYFNFYWEREIKARYPSIADTRLLPL